MKKRALITGGGGFIGANLARHLLREGCETHLLLRPSYRLWRIREIEADVRIHLAPLDDKERVHSVVRSIRPEWVFNLAASGSYPSQTDWNSIVAANLTGCRNLLESCLPLDVEAFVQAGSSSEYGYKDHAAHEDEQVRPNSDYAVTKAAATHLVQMMADKHRMRAVTARFYSVYGPYEEPSRFIPALVVHGLRRQLPSLVSPDTARDFVYIEDAVEAMLHLARKAPQVAGGVFNICTGVQTTIESAVEIARRLMDIPAQPVWTTMEARPWDTTVWLGSPLRMQQEVGWTARTPFETGFRHTMDWFQLNPFLLDLYQKRLARSEIPSSRDGRYGVGQAE
jgi:dolichol-phosphate mannosyltransferase